MIECKIVYIMEEKDRLQDGVQYGRVGLQYKIVYSMEE